MYQLMFAIITPALIVGAIAERMKFSAILLFVTLWMFVVYFPLAHMVWGIDGLMNGVWNADAKIKAIDFAGGTVVHMSSGWSALILCLILGKRLGFGKEPMPPHSMVLCMVGTGMLWVGWYGFNAGSAVAADGVAANAFTTTTLATAVASFVWAMAEYRPQGQTQRPGFCSGAVAGLGGDHTGLRFCERQRRGDHRHRRRHGSLLRLLQGQGLARLRRRAGHLRRARRRRNAGRVPDRLPGHARRERQPRAPTSRISSATTLWIEQLKAIGVTLILAVVGTTVIAYVVKAVVGLRVGRGSRVGRPGPGRTRRRRLSRRLMGGTCRRPATAPGLGFAGIDEAIRAPARGNEAV